jgi:hypothetical protein
MRPGSPELTAALAAGQRSYDLSLRLGGKDVADQVESWTYEHSYTSGLPDQVAFTTGAAAAKCSATLVGPDGRTAAQRYSPWAPRWTADVTRPGQSAVLAWGLDGYTEQTMRGRITTIHAAAKEGTAAVTALDGAETLRGPAWLPPVMDTTAVGVSTPWVIDHALRMSGIYTSPPPRPGSILFASMNCGIDANIGMRVARSGITGFNRARSPWTAGPVSTASGGYAITWAPQRRVLSQQGTLVVDWWVRVPDTGTAEASSVELVWRGGETGTATTVRVTFDPAAWTMAAAVDGGSTAWTVTSGLRTPGRVKVTFQIILGSLTTPIQVRGWMTGPSGQYATPTYTGAVPVYGWLHTVTARSRAPMECVGVARASGTIPVTTPWAQTAHVLTDEAVTSYRLRAAPEVSGSWWDMIKSLADAMMLSFGFDEDGIFHAHGRDYLAPDVQVQPDRVVTAARDLADVGVTEEADGIANVVSCAHTHYDTPGVPALEDYWTDTVARTIPALSTIRFVVDDTQRAWMTPTPMPYSAAGTGTPGASRVRFLTASGGLAPVETEMVHTPDGLEIVYHNRGVDPATAHTATSGGVPSLTLARWDVTSAAGRAQVATDTASIARYGDRSLQVSTSPWVQLAEVSEDLAERVLAWTAWPLPITGSIQILPDPRLQLGDVVRVRDSTGAMLDHLFRVLGIRADGRGANVTMTLTVRPMQRPARPVDNGLTTEPIADPEVAPVYPG